MSMSTTASAAMSTSTTATAGKTTRIAVGQVRATSDKFSNLLNVAKCAGWAASPSSSAETERGTHNKCTMLFLPECFGYMGETSEDTLREAEPPLPVSTEAGAAADNAQQEQYKNSPRVTKALRDAVAAAAGAVAARNDGEVEDSKPVAGDIDSEGERIFLLDGLRTIARESNLWISGTMHVAGAPPRPPYEDNDGDKEEDRRSRVYNTHVVVDNEGVLRASYNKIHLFDVSIPGQVQLQESKTTAPGTRLEVCDDTPAGALGLSTCYDVRFPELYSELVERGARILSVPSAFTVPTGRAHWHVLLRGK